MSRTVTGTYTKPDGSPERGKLLFSPSVVIHSTDEVILPNPSHVKLDSNGQFSITLECTTDPSWSPSGWTWKVVERIKGGRTFYFELPAGGTVDLATLNPLTEAPVVYEGISTDPHSGEVNVLDHGAVGDGTTDDTNAIRAAIDVLESGMSLMFPSGYTFKHTSYLEIANLDRIQVTGGGTLAHVGDTDGTSALMFDGCYDVTVSDLTLTSTSTTRRESSESHKILFNDCSAVHVKDISIDGSQASGIMLQSVTNFVIENCTVENTNADSFHITHGSKYGLVRNCVSNLSGDDGFAIVSYDSHPTMCEHIDFNNLTVTNQFWGRGLAIIGGSDITVEECSVTESAGAGVYIACEDEYDTWGVWNVSFKNITLDGCVQQAASVAGDRPRPAEAQLIHGAITIYCSRAAYDVDGVSFDGVTILNTEPDAWYEVMLVNYDAGHDVKNVDLANFTITSTKTLLATTLLGTEDYNTRNWLKSGVRQTDHIGFDYRGMSVGVTGGTMTGELILSGDPTDDLGAATKQYVDNASSADVALLAPKASPTFTGTATAADLDVTGTLDVSSGTTYLGATSIGGTATVERVGDATNAALNILRDSGYRGYFQFGTANAGAGLRWRLGVSDDTESGSNAGSALNIESFDDSGNHLGWVLNITRSNGNVWIGGEMAASKFTLGTLTYSAPNAFTTMQKSTNNYAQHVIQNSSSGSTASADYVVNNDLSTDTTYYGDFGINSSTFSGTGSLSLPNATYLVSANGELVIGTWTANGIRFVINQGATDIGGFTSSGFTAAQPIVNKTANYTITLADYTVTVDASGGNVTITLPTAASASGRCFNIKKTDSSTNYVRVAGNGAETIDGSNTQDNYTQWASMCVQSNGTSWVII